MAELTWSPGFFDAVQQREGFFAKPYWDYKQWTSGFGTRAANPSETIDRAEAQKRLGVELSKARQLVQANYPNLAPHQAEALTDLTFNAGPGWMNSGLGELVRSGRHAEAAERIKAYNKAGGKVLPGLVDRRNWNSAYYLGGPKPGDVPSVPAVPASAPGSPNVPGAKPPAIPNHSAPNAGAPAMAYSGATPESVAQARAMAQALMAQGLSGQPVQHWTQALGRVLQSGVGGMWQAQAAKDEAAGKAAGNQALAAALQGGDPQQAIAALNANPWTQGMGQQLAGSLISARFTGEKPTDEMREYQKAVNQGYKGSFMDYKTELKKAGANTVTVDNRAENSMEKARGEGLGKRFNTIAEDGIKADEDATMLSRITQLNSNVDPGTRTAIMESIRQATGIALDPNADNVQAFKAATAYLVPRMRVPGSGASSDRDMVMFQQALPELLGTPGGNEIAIQTLGGLVQQRKARAEIAEAWQRGEIDAKEADARMKALPDPFEGFKKANPATRKPVSTSPKVPAQALEMLKANPSPEMKAKFDQVFGAGAADAALGALNGR